MEKSTFCNANLTVRRVAATRVGYVCALIVLSVGLMPARVVAQVGQPPIQNPVNSLLEAANKRLQAKDYRGAIRAATDILSLPDQEQNLIALKIRALAYCQLGDPDSSANAIQDYDILIAANPKDSPSLQNRGVSYFRLQQYDKAAADADLWMAAEPTSANPYLLKGLSLLSMKPARYAEAISTYNKAMEIGRDELTIRYNRGVSYLMLGQWNRAIADLEVAAKDPKLSQERDIRGMIDLARRGSPEAPWRAIERLKAVVAANPNDGAANYELATLLQVEADTIPAAESRRQALLTAIPYYTRALEILRSDARPRVGRGTIYLALGQWENAIADADAALALDSANVAALFLRADSNLKRAGANRNDTAVMTTAATAAARDYAALLALPGLRPDQRDDALKGQTQAHTMTGGNPNL